MEKTFMQAMQDRYAVKAFKPEADIEPDTFEKILETGRLSPSSFGLEPTRFLVVRDPAIRAELKAACGGQPQIDTCSELVVFVTVKEFDGITDYAKKQFGRWGLDDNAMQGVLNFYGSYISQFNEQTRPYWSGKQAYIALGNMMTAAQVFGIGSCPIEGFDKDQAMKALKLDANQYDLHVIMALGEPADQARPKHRLPLTDLVTHL